MTTKYWTNQTTGARASGSHVFARGRQSSKRKPDTSHPLSESSEETRHATKEGSNEVAGEHKCCFELEAKRWTCVLCRRGNVTGEGNAVSPYKPFYMYYSFKKLLEDITLT